MAATAMGCADIRLKTVDTQTEVLSRRQKIVAGRSVKVRSRIDGTTLYLQTNQGCDLVEMEEVRTVETREADEDLTEEFTVLGLSTLPLTTGIVMLVDAPNVYDNDRNANRYNSVGPTGAYAGGTVLTAVGGIMALVPIVELMRVAAAGEERETTSTRQGSVVSSDVQCEASSRPVRTSVVLRVGARNLTTRGTDNNGHLELDLAKAIPYDVAKKAVMVQVIVAGKVVGELDIEPILDAQEEIRREQEVQVWKSVDKEKCANAPPSDKQACTSVRSFLSRFPDGMFAEEAREILRNHERGQDKVIAEDPDAKEKEEAVVPVPEKKEDFGKAKDDAKKLQRRACQAACAKNCRQKGTKCLQACVKEVCK
jgi:hypothetical protein